MKQRDLRVSIKHFEIYIISKLSGDGNVFLNVDGGFEGKETKIT